MTKGLLLGIAGALALSFSNAPVQAQSSDAIIDKLVEKGILTLDEAKELRHEADEDFTTAYQTKTSLPDWVTALKLNGSFRGRFEGFYSDNPAWVDRSRFRYRLLFGVTAVMKERFEVGFRLGSGNLNNAQGLATGVNPISNNDTLSNNGSKKGIYVDMAYASWQAFDGPTLKSKMTFGKMKNPYDFSPLVFDSDYTPEGFALGGDVVATEQHTLGYAGGGFIMDEIGSSANDPWMIGGQVQLESKWSEKISTVLGLSGLYITDDYRLTTTSVPNINVGNTRDASGALIYDYNPIIANASFTYTVDEIPLYPGKFPINVGGYYMTNPGAPDGDNQGYSAKVQFGKSGKRGHWDLSYEYRFLDGDAWYEEVVDSDFGAYYAAEYGNSGLTSGYGSGTNVKGHIAQARYSPYDMLTLSAKVFFTQLVDDPIVPAGVDAHSDMVRLQVDAAWKF